MSKYLIDTNIVTYMEDQSSLFHQVVIKKFSQLADNDMVCVSLLTLYEIHYGIALADKEQVIKLLALKSAVEKNFPIVPLRKEGAEIFGQLKAAFRKKIGASGKVSKRDDVDFLIASTAIAEEATLVSNDKIFKEIKKLHGGFKLENWAEKKSN
jgi:predicted nucleic acid-binding protein